ncbi:MAG: type II toxin-antitoxin system HicA family toxin [Bacilli bacterium]
MRAIIRLSGGKRIEKLLVEGSSTDAIRGQLSGKGACWISCATDPLTKPGKTTVPHPRKDLDPRTVRSISKQSGLHFP